MQYLGSKKRIAKHILPIILKSRNENQPYIEPFAGGMNMIDKVDGIRIANDNNYYLIELFKALQQGWTPPDNITKEEYMDIKDNKDNYPPQLVAFVGFLCSFGGKWFGGYAKNKIGTNYCQSGKKVLLKQIKSLMDVQLLNQSYDQIEYPPESLIYCDPPYYQTTEYKDKFDSCRFYEWVKTMTNEGHTIYFSEYSAPEEFRLVWSMEVKTNLNRNQPTKRIENLYTM